jgi:uncharacterized membrane protein
MGRLDRFEIAQDPLPREAARVARRMVRRARLQAWAAGLHLLLLAAWAGAMAFFAFVVAPAAFAVLPSRHLAGELVTRIVGAADAVGILAAALILLTALISRPATAWRRPSGALSLTLYGLLLLAPALSSGLISPRLLAMRQAMGRPIEAVAESDPLRVTFNQLHQASVTLLTVALVAALVAFGLAWRQGSRRER